MLCLCLRLFGCWLCLWVDLLLFWFRCFVFLWVCLCLLFVVICLLFAFWLNCWRMQAFSDDLVCLPSSGGGLRVFIGWFIIAGFRGFCFLIICLFVLFCWFVLFCCCCFVIATFGVRFRCVILVCLLFVMLLCFLLVWFACLMLLLPSRLTLNCLINVCCFNCLLV